jgi:hypothetical protein
LEGKAVSTQSPRRHAAPSLPARSSFILATVSAIAGAAVGVSAYISWHAYDDSRDTPVTTTNIVPGSGVTPDSIQPSSRESSGSVQPSSRMGPMYRHFTGDYGFVDSDPSVRLDFVNEVPERLSRYPEHDERHGGLVFP